MTLTGLLILIAYLAIGLFVHSVMSEIGNDVGSISFIFIIAWPVVLATCVFMVIVGIIMKFGSWVGKHINKILEGLL